MTTEAHNERRGARLVAELVALGVDCFCVAPGSRSTPLAVAAARHPSADAPVFTDERSAAFYALGLGRATGRPAAVITTSGTAVGNLVPATLEAGVSSVPLLLLTADRPQQLRDTGANQTVDQLATLGGVVRWQVELPCPGEGFTDAALATTLAEAVARAGDGPVHVNCPFHEPLGGIGGEVEERAHPRVQRMGGEQRLSEAEADDLADLLGSARRGLLVVGALDAPADRTAARQLASALGWPVHADITSGLRLGSTEHALVPFDILLRSEAFAAALDPQVVLHLGGPVVSKRYHQWLAASGPRQVVRCSPHGRRLDPSHTVTRRVHVDTLPLVRQLVPRLDPRVDLAWRGRLLSAARAAAAAMHPGAALTEPAIAEAVSEAVRGGLFVASSLSIRHLDWFGRTEGEPVDLSSNRGASGIDGTVASALGWARGRNQPTTLLTGDQALLHDASSWPLLRRERLVVVVVNNGGGGIFSLLPVRAAIDLFEGHFAAAHELRFEGIARWLELPYAAPGSLDELRRALHEAGGRQGSTLIELITDRNATAGQLEALTRAAVDAAEASLGAPC